MRKNVRKSEKTKRRFFSLSLVLCLIIVGGVMAQQLPSGFHISFSDSDEKIFNVTIYEVVSDFLESERFNQNYKDLNDFKTDLYNCSKIRVIVKFKDSIIYNRIIESSTDALDIIELTPSDFNLFCDINNDGKIGLEEAIYALQIVSQTITY